MYTIYNVGWAGLMPGRGELLLGDVKRLGSGDLLREGVPVHYGPGYRWVFVTVHRRLVLLELPWFSPWLLAWVVWGRNIHYGFGDPVHHRDAAVGPSLLKWLPFKLMYHFSHWGGVLSSVGFVHDKSCLELTVTPRYGVELADLTTSPSIL